jgi:pimeloyl-ACP methyl ester carboxylesterase
MEGGVGFPDALSPELKKEFYDVGARRGHYQGFLSLLSHEKRWSDARNEYPRIRIPTLLIYGEHDWAPSESRERDRRLIPGVTMTTVDGGGHFLSLDQPQPLTDLIVRFVTTAPGPVGAEPWWQSPWQSPPITFISSSATGSGSSPAA